jgi:hypothetical protein
MAKKKSPKKVRSSVQGKMIVLQQMGEMVDGKIHFLAGEDQDVFNIEDGDKFFTAIFMVDPFKQR